MFYNGGKSESKAVMDPETAQALFDKGAFLVFLNAPEEMEFGIDCNSWRTGPKFMGVKLIPPGLHYVHYSASANSGAGLRNGFFKFYEEREIVIKEWDSTREDVKNDFEIEEDQRERISSDMRRLDPYLGAYPLSPPTTWRKWVHLTDFISRPLISRVLPHQGKISNISDSSIDEEEIAHLGKHEKTVESEGEAIAEDSGAMQSTQNDVTKMPTNDTQETRIEFTKFDLKKSWRQGATGPEVTRYAQDKSWLLRDLLERVYNQDPKELLGELQLAFVCLLIAGNFAGLTQWRSLIQLVCSCQEALEQCTDTLFTRFLDVLSYQLEECQMDFFYEIEMDKSFLLHALKALSRNIDLVYSTSATPQKLHTLKRRFESFRAFLDKKFNWTWVRESQDEDEDEGEYAPVVVELDEDYDFNVQEET